MKDTPETKVFKTRIRGIDGDKHWVPAGFAEILERERDEAKKLLDKKSKHLAQVIAERDHAETELRKLIDFSKSVLVERDEAREDASHWKIEYKIVEARLCGGKHERDNGIVSEREIIPKLQCERDEARAVLSNLSHYLSCGLGDDSTTAQEYAARIREGINFLLTPVLEDNRKLRHVLREAWLAMDEVEGIDRIDDWQNKNAHVLDI